MTQPSVRDVAVIGAGIGGLTAALALARAGSTIKVYEQAPALTEVGAGLQVSPNGARVLSALGLDGAAATYGQTAEAVTPMNALTGRQVTRFDLSAQTPPYRFFHRYALVEMLYQAALAAGVTFVFDAAIRTDPLLCNGTQAIEADLIVSADGLHSVVRPLVTAASQPFFTGQVAWRGIVAGHKAPPIARIWMGPGKHVVTYPLQGVGLNVVAVQERSEWAAEGWHHADDPANLMAAFADCTPALTGILSQVETPYLWGLFRHPVAAHWYKDNMVLLGDAAHPTLPFMAQGANLAMEDAYVLGAALQSNRTLSDGLAAYQAKRHARVVRAIEAANGNARNYHLSGLPARVAHMGLGVMGKVAPDAFLGRLSWLYDHDVTKDTYQLAAV